MHFVFVKVMSVLLQGQKSPTILKSAWRPTSICNSGMISSANSKVGNQYPKDLYTGWELERNCLKLNSIYYAGLAIKHINNLSDARNF